MTVEIRLSGVAAQGLAEPAEDLLRSAADAEPERRKPVLNDEVSKGDPVAVAALILSVPGAVLAMLDLAERARLAERVRHLLAKVRGSEGAATLHVGAEPPLDLSTATDDEVMDLLAKSPAQQD